METTTTEWNCCPNQELQAQTTSTPALSQWVTALKRQLWSCIFLRQIGHFKVFYWKMCIQASDALFFPLGLLVSQRVHSDPGSPAWHRGWLLEDDLGNRDPHYRHAHTVLWERQSASWAIWQCYETPLTGFVLGLTLRRIIPVMWIWLCSFVYLCVYVHVFACLWHFRFGVKSIGRRTTSRWQCLVTSSYPKCQRKSFPTGPLEP